jgi:hypothetical protein
MSSLYGHIQNATNDGILSNRHANSFMIGFLSGGLVLMIKNYATNSETDINETIKVSTQSGIAACALSDAKNKFECGHHLEGALSLAIGAGGVYLVEKVASAKGVEHA